ncbi:MAG: sulfate adenylyltransferase subunit CysN [Polyangiaceae bacterium]|nr:sulfate adenylyltransferase subunit CysN [Polyangiaceae bacterium]
MRSQEPLALQDVESYLAQHQRKEILRFLTAGSVDDGKSTLIGRLLHDSRAVYDDQVAALRRDSARRGAAGGEIDYSLLVDGLLSEREQGITIDVAYRYFTTPRRKFIIADTPGHEQYTRNMATGASTADLAIILIDARRGVLQQTRRHSFIASLLGIRRAVVAVNKMDLVGYDQRVFEAIRREYEALAGKLDFAGVHYLPLSALRGDNVVERSARMPFYDGPPLLEHLETVPVAGDRELAELRFPVQIVLRPNLDFRGFAGTVASGVVRRGDRVTALPSGRTSRVRSIVTYDGELAEAAAPMSVTVTLEDEIDLSRGDMLVHEASMPHAGRAFEATVVWMSEQPMRQGASYWIKHTTRTVTAEATAIHHLVDVSTLEERPGEELGLNDIGRVTITASRPLFFDAYRKSRATGAFILIDRLTNATVGAGMITGPAREPAAAAAGAPERVSAAERARRLGQGAAVIRIEAADPERAAALAVALERRLFDEGLAACALDPARTRGLDAAASARLAADLGFLVLVPAGAAAGEELRAALQGGAARLVEVLVPVGPLEAAAGAISLARGLTGAGFVR